MNKHPIFIISGKQGEGKTTALIKVIDELWKDRIAVAGFIADGEWEKGLRTRFYIRDVANTVKMILCQSEENKEFKKQGRFYFNHEAIQLGAKLVQTKEVKQVVVLDEIGLFEINGHVWAPVFKKLISIDDTPVVITVRNTFVEQVISTFNITKSEVFNCKTRPELIAKKIQKVIG